MSQNVQYAHAAPTISHVITRPARTTKVDVPDVGGRAKISKVSQTAKVAVPSSGGRVALASPPNASTTYGARVDGGAASRAVSPPRRRARPAGSPRSDAAFDAEYSMMSVDWLHIDWRDREHA